VFDSTKEATELARGGAKVNASSLDQKVMTKTFNEALK
jgi:hypothetical protein